jgi:3',5'-cyclic AMP phosphodiesterase CpdA
MANKMIKRIYCIIIGLFTMSGCYKDIDLGGFIRSKDNVNERFSQSLRWNAQNPSRIIYTDTDNYSMIIAADSHVGTTRNFKKLLGLSGVSEIAALFIAGDITTGKKEDYDVVKQLIDDADSVTCFLLAGNHDLYFEGWQIFYDYFGSSTYTVTVNTPLATDIYICIDTGGGTAGDKQLEWLKDILVKNRHNYRHCVIITHNNFFRNRYTTSTNPLVEELYVLLELFFEYDVNLVITGHDHKRYEEVFGPTTYITLDAAMDGLSYASYLKLVAADGQLDYQFTDM